MYSIIVLIIEFLIMALLRPNGNIEVSNSLATVMILIESIAVCFDLNKFRNRQAQLPLFLGYLWRLFLLYFDIFGKNIFVLPNSSSDAVIFYNEALFFSETGVPGRHGKFFSIIMGTLFKVVGNSKLYGEFFIMLVSFAAIYCMVRTLEELNIDSTLIALTTWIIGLLPNFAILSVVFMRESFVTFMLTVSLLFFAKWMQKSSALYFVIAFVFTFIAASFHSGSIAIAVGFVAVLFLYDRESQKYKFNVKNIVPVLAFIIVFIFLFLNYGDLFFSKFLRYNSVADFGEVAVKGGSSYSAYVGSSSNLGDMVIFTIPRFLYFMFSPFPWQWRSVNDIIAFVFSSGFYMSVFGVVLKYLKKHKTKNKRLLIAFFIVAICIIFIFSWGVTNTGTAVRHRDKMVTLFGIMLALALNKQDENLYTK